MNKRTLIRFIDGIKVTNVTDNHISITILSNDVPIISWHNIPPGHFYDTTHKYFYPNLLIRIYESYLDWGSEHAINLEPIQTERFDATGKTVCVDLRPTNESDIPTWLGYLKMFESVLGCKLKIMTPDPQYKFHQSQFEWYNRDGGLNDVYAKYVITYDSDIYSSGWQRCISDSLHLIDALLLKKYASTIMGYSK